MPYSLQKVTVSALIQQQVCLNKKVIHSPVRKILRLQNKISQLKALAMGAGKQLLKKCSDVMLKTFLEHLVLPLLKPNVTKSLSRNHFPIEPGVKWTPCSRKMAQEVKQWKIPYGASAKKRENSFKQEIMYTFQAWHGQGDWKSLCHHLARLAGCSER